MSGRTWGESWGRPEILVRIIVDRLYRPGSQDVIDCSEVALERSDGEEVAQGELLSVLERRWSRRDAVEIVETRRDGPVEAAI